MTTRATIKQYCKDAKELAIAFMVKKQENKIFKRNVSWEEIDKEFSSTDFDKYEIYRSMHCNDGRLLYTYDVDFHIFDEWKTQPELGLYFLLKEIKKLNEHEDLTEQLLWKFTGRGLHGSCRIKDTPKMIEKFKSIYNFSKELTKYFNKYIKYNADTQIFHKRGLIRSIGSINLKSKLHCIPINLNWSAEKIIEKSKKNSIDKTLLVQPLNFRIQHFINSLEYKQPKKILNGNLKIKIEKCPFLEYTFDNSIQNGKKNSILTKNMAIYLYGRKNREELEKKYKETQGDPLLNGWYRYVERGDMTHIMCDQLFKFQQEFNVKPNKCLDCKYGKIMIKGENKK